jgi:hypothetical protein
MLLIIISWIYIFWTALSFGLAFSKRVKVNPTDLIFIVITGLFSITLLASIWAFWFPIAKEFHLLFFGLTALLWYQNKSAAKSLLATTFSTINSFNKTIKWSFFISSLMIIAKCATTPYLVDNETYYIQTIKWLNEYGLVKGLANLHLFLGQASPWHITQSIYNFNFIYDRFNDINGFLLLFFNFFVFLNWQKYLTSQNKIALIFALCPLSYLFLFQFISAPSPDFPIYIFSFLLFYHWCNSNQISKHDLLLKLSILALFAAFIKITAFPLLLLPLGYYCWEYKSVYKNLGTLKIAAGTTITVIVVKNSILTGYPFFPFQFLSFPNLNYKVPTEIMEFFFSEKMMYNFCIPYNSFENVTTLAKINSYFFHNGLDSIIAIITVLLCIISPIYMHKSAYKKQLYAIYCLFILVLILLGYSSPQYRFYVYFTIFFGLALLSLFIKSQKAISLLNGLSISLLLLLLCIPLSFKAITANKLLEKNNTFCYRNLVVPEANSKYQLKFKGDSRGNLKFNTPINPPLFWINGNGNLPTVNAAQLSYFETNFHYMPQQRSHNLADGFYAQKISGHE